MKTFSSLLFLALAALVFSACSGKPSEDDFKTMILEANNYPVVRDTEVDIYNHFMAADFLKLKLEEQGYVKIDKARRRLDEQEKPFIEFTEKAKPFLIGEPVKSTERLGGTIQKLASYKIEFIGITGLKFNKDENKAIVLYEEVYKDVSPFANVYSENPKRVQEGEVLSRKAYFSKYEDGWRLENNPGMEFLSF